MHCRNSRRLFRTPHANEEEAFAWLKPEDLSLLQSMQTKCVCVKCGVVLFRCLHTSIAARHVRSSSLKRGEIAEEHDPFEVLGP